MIRLGGLLSVAIKAAEERVNMDPQLSIVDSFHQLVTLPLCSHPPKNPSLILIDALDESGSPVQREELLRTLAHEIPLLPGTIKVLLTSNPEQDIERALDQLGTETIDGLDVDGYRRLTFDVYGEKNRQDLRRFIQHAFARVAESIQASGITNNWPSFEQRQGLVTHANGLFLWVKVAADHVLGSANPQAALDELLKLTTPASPEAALDALYSHVLSSVANSKRFEYKAYHEIMGQVLVPTSTSLTIDSICQKAGYDVSSTIYCLQALLTLEPVVRITHRSLREFVQNSKKCESRFLIQEPQSGMSSPLHPELHLRFPLHKLATINHYPGAQHLAPDVGSQIDPNSISDTPAAKGASGDIYRARFTDGLEVAIKSIRAYGASDSLNHRDFERRCMRELTIWSRVEHSNILGLLGICVLGGEIAMVSEWMPNNNVRDYVTKHPHISRVKLMEDIAAGLQYLHDNNIIHGDLKGVNVVVSVAGSCRLVDFGLAKLANGYLGITTTTTMGTFRWMSPELMDTDENERAVVTFASDIWALGMEVFTCHVPFAEYESPLSVIVAVCQGKIPKRPLDQVAPELDDSYWELLKNCWSFQATRRPCAGQVVEKLAALASSSKIMEIIEEVNA
ncbi:Tyrosine kinase family catalytic domain protein [Ceratobasidium sp. AG-Ba]|nr:Tyrosine kinase family catalytic domain protein [Ceratobasidium sp. AG-Ba]